MDFDLRPPHLPRYNQVEDWHEFRVKFMVYANARGFLDIFTDVRPRKLSPAEDAAITAIIVNSLPRDLVTLLECEGAWTLESTANETWDLVEALVDRATQHDEDSHIRTAKQAECLFRIRRDNFRTLQTYLEEFESVWEDVNGNVGNPNLELLWVEGMRLGLGSPENYPTWPVWYKPAAGQRECEMCKAKPRVVKWLNELAEAESNNRATNPAEKNRKQQRKK